jgi:hypothetical protein
MLQGAIEQGYANMWKYSGVGRVFRAVFAQESDTEEWRGTYCFSRTLLKNCIVDRCSSFPSGTNGFSSQELLNFGPSAVFRNSSYWSGSAKQVGAMGRDTSAGSADSWLAVLQRPEAFQRTLWTPMIRLTRCWGLMTRNSVLEIHSGSPSEKAKHSKSVQLVRCSAEEVRNEYCCSRLDGYLQWTLVIRVCRGTGSPSALYVETFN